MTNKLTKQYRKGILQSGFYYFKNCVGETYAVDHHNVKIKGLSGVEVLSKVPGYSEHEKLKKKLELATKGLWFIYYQSDRKDMYDCAEGTLKQLEELEK